MFEGEFTPCFLRETTYRGFNLTYALFTQNGSLDETDLRTTSKGIKETVDFNNNQKWIRITYDARPTRKLTIELSIVLEPKHLVVYEGSPDEKELERLVVRNLLDFIRGVEE